MSEIVQLQVEFPAGESVEDITPQMFAEAVRSVFDDIGVDEQSAAAGIVDVRFRRRTPLAVDPAAATIFVGLLVLSAELVKLAVDMDLRERELDLKAQELDLQRQAQARESVKRDDQLLSRFIEKVIKPKLAQKLNVPSAEVVIRPRE